MYDTRSKVKQPVYVDRNYIETTLDESGVYTENSNPVLVQEPFEKTVYSYRGPIPERDEFGWLPVHDFRVISRNVSSSGSFEAEVVDRIIFPKRRYKYHGIGYILAGNPELNPGTWFPTHRADVAAALRKEAIQKAYAEANSPDFDSLVQLAELDESVRQIAANVPALVKNFKRFRKQVLREKKRSSGAGGGKKTLNAIGRSLLKNGRKQGRNGDALGPAAQGWLTWRYGILPNILAWEDFIDYLKMVDNRTAKGSVNNSSVSRTYHTVDFINKRFTFERTITRVTWANTKLYLGKRPKVEDHGFTWRDGLRAVWERTPFSFLFDWKVPIGLWLDSHRKSEEEIIHQSNTVCETVTFEVKLLKEENIPDYYWGDSYERNVSLRGFGIRATQQWMVRDSELDNVHGLYLKRSDLITERSIDALALTWLKTMKRR